MATEEKLVERLVDAEVGYRPHVVGKLLSEAADAISRLVEERDEARELAQLFSQVSRNPEWIARATAAEARVAQLETDLAASMAERERMATTAVIAVGNLSDQVAQLETALREVVADYDACSGAEPSLSVLHRSIDLVARTALSQSPDRESGT